MFMYAKTLNHQGLSNVSFTQFVIPGLVTRSSEDFSFAQEAGTGHIT